MTTARTNTVRLPRSCAGAYPTVKNRATAAARAIAGSLYGHGARAGAASGTGTGAAAGAAETATGGGGQVISPARTTVMDRWTVSSQSRTRTPSFPGVSSLSRLTRLVPY